MSRSHGVVSSKRKAQARKHAEFSHYCEICGATCYGNGFYTHYRFCILRLHPDLAAWEAKAMRQEYYKRIKQPG